MKRHLRLPFKGDYEKNKENLEWMAKYPEGSFIPTKPRIISKADTLDTYRAITNLYARNLYRLKYIYVKTYLIQCVLEVGA